jgi:transcription elongation factor Elf1
LLLCALGVPLATQTLKYKKINILEDFMKELKYLKAFLTICDKHCEDDCKGCPFAPSSTGSTNCHSWIISHEDEARVRIVEYVNNAKAQAEADTKCGFYVDGVYSTQCRNCGKSISIKEKDLVWDSYIDAFLFNCPHCGAEDEVPASVKKVGV